MSTSFIKCMRWKAHFFLHPSESKKTANNYNHKSTKSPPQVDEIKPFEDDLLKMLENVKFRLVNNPFQSELRKDIKKINSSSNVLVFADTSRNVYELEKEQHEKLLRENITKSYKKTDEQAMDTINQELQSITKNLNISDRIETMAKNQAFITLKDHKDNFSNNPTCRLINPAKSNLGRVSKQILEEINDKVRAAAKLNQWKNTYAVINWFRNLQGNQALTFVVFDIVDFYPSIAEKLLTCALDHASKFTVTDIV